MQIVLMPEITQSLAGRSAFIEPLPFSADELERAAKVPPSLEAMLYTGGYPAIYDRGLDPRVWLAAYVTAYVERDVRQLLKVQGLECFQWFVHLCTGRGGQILRYRAAVLDARHRKGRSLTRKNYPTILRETFIEWLS